MLVAVRVAAVLSTLASFLALGLSAMASDDMTRSAAAGRLQLLVLAWLIVSIATLLLAGPLVRRGGWLVLAPMLVIGAWAMAKLARF